MFKGLAGVFLRWTRSTLSILPRMATCSSRLMHFPLLPALMRLTANTVLVPLSLMLSYKQQLVIAGILVANASFIVASVQLYRLSKALFGRESFAFLTAMLYVLTPSGIFMSAIYTESVFAALSFTGMLFAAQKQYFLAAMTWSISCTARSNGILYAGFILYDLIVRMDLESSVLQKMWALSKAVFLSAVTWLGFLAVQAYGYSLYCSDVSNLEQREWCGSSAPLIYTYVQDKYWNVGFMRYYEVKQIPNFLMAAPMVILSASGIACYAQYDLRRMLSLGRLSSVSQTAAPSFMSLATYPYIVLWAVLLMSSITTMHIQIITRAFSCMPPVYWYAAHQFEAHAKGGWTKTVTTFFVMYGLIGIVLFANFFPPA
ncbi:unnamed protein product [Mortierella alpina]